MSWVDIGPMDADEPLDAGTVDTIRQNLNALIEASQFDIQYGYHEGDRYWKQRIEFGLSNYTRIAYMHLLVPCRPGTSLRKRKLKVSCEAKLGASTTAYLSFEMRKPGGVAAPAESVTITSTTYQVYSVTLEPNWGTLEGADTYPSDTIGSYLVPFDLTSLDVKAVIPNTPAADVYIRGVRFEEVL